MNRQRIAKVLAALCFGGSIVAAANSAWFWAIGFYGSALFVWIACRKRTIHRQVLAVHEQARRAAIVDHLILSQAPVPCCSFWKNSDGEVHGPDCTRPTEARRDDYRLDDAGRAAFEEIAAHWDDRSAA